MRLREGGHEHGEGRGVKEEVVDTDISVIDTVKRDLLQCQRRPTTVSKETYYSVKRDLLQCQKRPTTVSKETYYSVKRPTTVSKETYYD